MSLDLTNIDFKEFEPLTLDQCTVITDIKKFFESHRATAAAYKKRGCDLMAAPYIARGKAAKQKLEELINSKHGTE